MEDLWFASASEIARRITGRSVTAVEVAEAFLKHIAVHDRLLNSFLNVMTDQALDAAQRVDDALRAGRPPGPLAGVPVAVKDLIDIAGMPTTAGAHRRFHTMAHEDAPVVTRLRGAGSPGCASVSRDTSSGKNWIPRSRRHAGRPWARLPPRAPPFWTW